MKTIQKSILFCCVFSLLFMSSCSSDNEGIETLNSESIDSKEIVFNKKMPVQADVKFHQHDEGNLIISLNEREKKVYNYFVIQHENKIDNSKLTNGIYNIKLNSNYLSLDNSDKSIIFTLDDKKLADLVNNKAQYISVYGISKRFSGEKELSIAQMKFGGITCHSGGEGASECSAESGSPMSGNCSVSCRNGYYACCDDTRNECKCIKESITHAP